MELFSKFFRYDTCEGSTVLIVTPFSVVKTHAWINAEMMMEGCMVGYMVRE